VGQIRIHFHIYKANQSAELAGSSVWQALDFKIPGLHPKDKDQSVSIPNLTYVSRPKLRCALMAAQARFLRSLPPKVTCVEEAQDKVPFVKHVNEIRGEKEAPEVTVEK
jgi:hypothetical protein